MKTAKRYITIALSFALCMTVFAAFAPRVAHAVTATMVQVVNTWSNPVPIQGNGPRQLIQVEANAALPAGDGNDCGTGQFPFGTTYVVPTGKRFVVESVSTSGVIPSGQKFSSAILQTGSGHVGINHYLPPPLLMGSDAFGQFDFYQSAANYTTSSDAGSVLSLCASRASTVGSAGLSATINGYELDCSNGGCPTQP